MRKDDTALRGFLVSHWDEFRTTLQRLNGSADVRPSDGWTIFTPDAAGGSADVASFSFGPICFKVPERADDSHADLYVVTEGTIGLRRDVFRTSKTVVTDSFTTHVGYFRITSKGAEHVFGAHYDFDLNKLGHPIFHTQIRSFAKLWPVVAEQFNLQCDMEDRVKGMLRTVRVPTAQMDVFALCLQLFADHLLLPASNADFDKLVGKSAAIKGAAFQAPRLAEEAARICYRAPHWYPV